MSNGSTTAHDCVRDMFATLIMERIGLISEEESCSRLRATVEPLSSDEDFVAAKRLFAMRSRSKIIRWLPDVRGFSVRLQQ